MVRDFTAKKVGTICEGERIEVCPKCGKNGKREARKPKKGSPYVMFTHKSDMASIVGFGIDTILEWCHVPVFEERAPIG